MNSNSRKLESLSLLCAVEDFTDLPPTVETRVVSAAWVAVLSAGLELHPVGAPRLFQPV